MEMLQIKKKENKLKLDIEINNTQIYIAKEIDLAMLMNNSIKYSDNYSKTLAIL